MIGGGKSRGSGAAHLPLGAHRLVLRRKLEERRKAAVETKAAAGAVRKFVFDGVSSGMQLTMAELGQTCAGGPRGLYASGDGDADEFAAAAVSVGRHDAWAARSVDHRFGRMRGCGRRCRCSFFRAQTPRATTLASAQNRRTDFVVYSVWGAVRRPAFRESMGLPMEYPLNRPTIELRMCISLRRMKGRSSWRRRPVLDRLQAMGAGGFGRGKIKSQEQLTQELADEEKGFGSAADFGYGSTAATRTTQARATGFFRVEKDRRAMVVSSIRRATCFCHGKPTARRAEAGVRRQRRGAAADGGARPAGVVGMTTGGKGRPATVMLRWPQGTSFLGMPDVYSPQFAAAIDAAANTQCTPRQRTIRWCWATSSATSRPWNGGRASLCGLFLGGPLRRPRRS